MLVQLSVAQLITVLKKLPQGAIVYAGPDGPSPITSERVARCIRETAYYDAVTDTWHATQDDPAWCTRTRVVMATRDKNYVRIV